MEIEREVKLNSLLRSKKNISDYLASADVFCLSSLYESLPITLLETMAMDSLHLE
jgi:glycosyltransferase involved in cell wall biosynthesis